MTEVESVVRSYIDDAETTYTSALKLEDITDVPSGQRRNQVHFFRINGVAKQDAAQRFSSAVDVPFETVIGPNQVCRLEHCIEFWIKADPLEKAPTDPNIYKLARYTQRIKLMFENRLTKPVIISISYDAGQSWEILELTPGTARIIIDVCDAKPKLEAYRYRILPIDP